MKLLAIMLNNYFPAGVIRSDYINKIDVYDREQEQSILIQKICNDLFKKLPMLDQYVFFSSTGKQTVINETTIKNFITQALETNADQNVLICHKNGSALGRYYLHVYSITSK